MKFKVIFFISAGLFILITSCKKNPANTLEGTYSGNYYTDSITSGTASTDVVVVNPLTVSFTVNLASQPSFAVNDIAVLGDIEPYTLSYDGFQGVLNGSADDSAMTWILYRSSDTISFSGTKQ